MDCKNCGLEEVEAGRLALGYTTCLVCGEISAKAETALKSKRIAIAYPKGAYQYITDECLLEDLG